MALPKHFQELINQTLGNIGLNPSERTVFAYLLQNGKPQRVADIAKKAKINRTTLYGILKHLSERGLVSSAKEKGVLLYRSMEPALLMEYIERTREKLAADATKIREALPVIERVRKEGSRAYPSIQFFEGVEGIKQVYEDVIKTNPGKHLVGFTGANAIYELMDPAWIESFLKRRTEAGVFCEIISPDDATSRAYQSRDGKEARATRLLPPGFSYDIEVLAYENKTLLLSYAKDHPLAVLIEDEKIAETIKTIFGYTYSTLKD